jgi:hypothetical protein
MSYSTSSASMNISNGTSGAIAQAIMVNWTAIMIVAVNATMNGTCPKCTASAFNVADVSDAATNIKVVANPGINNASRLMAPGENAFFPRFNVTEIIECCVDCQLGSGVHIRGVSLGSKSIVFDSMDITLPLWLTLFVITVYAYACIFHEKEKDDKIDAFVSLNLDKKRSSKKRARKIRSLSKKMRFRGDGEKSEDVIADN